MKLNLRSARALCTAAEFELVVASGGEAIQALSEVRLKQKIVRARALRDKNRDLLRRQRLAARRPGAKPAPDGANARTEAKAALFEQTLARFVERLARLRGEMKRAAAKKAAARKPAVSSSAEKGSPAKRSAAKQPPKAKARVTPPQRSRKAPTEAVPSLSNAGKPAAFGFVSEKAAQRARNVKLKSMHARNVQAHVGAQGRRNQAKRDSRPR
jgi:hypothetical protein